MSKRKNKSQNKLSRKVIVENNERRKSNPLWIYLLASFIVLVVFVTIRFRFMDIPLDRDEGSYLYLGWAWLQGEIPYIDFYEIKPPGLFVAYAIFHLLFGYSNYLLHIGLLVLILHMAYLIGRIAYRLDFGLKMSVAAGLTFCMLTLNIATNAYGIMSEYFLLWTILLSTYFVLRYRGSSNMKWLFVGGLFLGLAAMIRQQAIFLAPIFPLLIYNLGDSSLKRYGIRLLYFALGAVCVIALFCIVMIAYGSWGEMLYWVFKRNTSSYMAAIEWDRGQEFLLTMLRKITNISSTIIIGGGIGIVASIFLKSARWKKAFIGLLLIGGLVSVVPGYRFYGHYWILVFWGWSMLCASVIGVVDQLISRKLVATIVQSIVLVVMCLSPIVIKDNLYLKNTGRDVVNAVYGNNPQEAVDVLTEYLNNRISKSDRLFVFGSEPQAYYNTRKLSLTKHIFIGFIHKPGDLNVRFQKDVIKILSEDKPKYIMHVQNPFSQGFSDDSDQSLYQWIYRHEQNYYTPIAYGDIHNFRDIDYIYGAEARNYQPKTDNYVILYERR